MHTEEVRSTCIYFQALGVLILGTGLHSHFTSTWAHAVLDSDPLPSGETMKHVYDVCKLVKLIPDGSVEDGLTSKRNCPSISLERYFVAAAIIYVVLSVIKS